MKSLDPPGSGGLGRFHELGQVAKLVPRPYPCVGAFARIIATNHFSRELPRSGLREESATGRDRSFSTSHQTFRSSTSPMGRRHTPSGTSQPIVLNATLKA
jgi:hypothetical protein